MKVTPDSLVQEHHESGAWSDLPLDEIFRQTAENHPDRIAIVDAPDRAT
jgi:mycobactin salicyl-AMP ligase